ncbi:hypothetical protein MRB53_039646 [Persea americana]|nr:hypothetical protein MRB53_039646 [Persea americana]
MGVLDRVLGGTNLEVFKVSTFVACAFQATRHSRTEIDLSIQFGMYIMFPIGWMYYFGTNLDNRFAVPDFWPKQGETHRIPFEREEVGQELERLKQRRLALRQQRLEQEKARTGSTGED